MSDDAAVAVAENNVETPSKGDKKKNRTSNISRATAEGEALLKEMGYEDKETPGRRRTRAAARGEVYTPPAKKERKEAGSGRRGRPKKAEKKEEEETEEAPAVEEEKAEKEDAEEDAADGEEEKPKDE